LAQQLSAVGVSANTIPYPTRLRQLSKSTITECSAGEFGNASRSPLKVLLAGMPRAEKGRDQIRTLLDSIETNQLRSGRLVWSMQLPSKRWERMIPKTMHDLYREAVTGPNDGALEVMQGNLTSESYHRWLDSADIGLFLYDPDRYAARCSGVLLEMMIRGVPVIVPNRCWLADQVREAGESYPIGWIYDSTEDIPAMLRNLEQDLPSVRRNCLRHAQHIAVFHSGRNTMQQMGISDQGLPSRQAAG
jgi:glycosyltransferase involved in cell wall biosynthesis